MKYKVEYRDFVIVETDNPQEAVDKVQSFVNSMKNMNEDTQSEFSRRENE